MNSKCTGIVDTPITSLSEDRLNMHSFEHALSEFIQHTNTPMTIAIQGEWGSGKTSLMNRLSEKLCLEDDSKFYSVWLNTWHYSLIDQPQNTLADIINTLIDEVITISKKEHPEKLKSVIKDVTRVSKNVFKGLSHMAMRTAIPLLTDEALTEFDSAVFNEKEGKRYNLNDLRKKLSTLITKTIEKNNEEDIRKDTFLFFIDDLDRIEPAIAVKILEMLKNIFDIEHCIFILAIDYDVVVSGLKPKFGELNESNEREFRSFFDKIIQLPFRMPVQSFIIDDFLKESLLSIDVISKEESKQDEFIKSLVDFARSSLGSNPRSLKRLSNSLSFIKLLMDAKQRQTGTNSKISSIEKQVSFAIVCLQIAFPSIYNLLADHPDFQNWDEEFAQKHQADLSSLKDATAIQQHDKFPYKWQGIIYAACHKSSYLSKHTYNIISILDRIKQIAADKNLLAGDLIADVFEYSSITNVKGDLKPKFEFNPVRVYYTINNKLLPILQEKLPKPFETVDRSGRIISKITYAFEIQGVFNKVIFQIPVKQHNLAVKIGFVSQILKSNTLNNEGVKNLEVRGKTEYFRQLCSSLIDLNEKYPTFHQITKPSSGLIVKKDKLIFEYYYRAYIESIEHLYTNKFLNEISNFIIDLAFISNRFSQSEWE